MITPEARQFETLTRLVTARLRQELLRLAALEDKLAADEAAKIPYWRPCPETVVGRRAAARALREDAELLLHAV